MLDSAWASQFRAQPDALEWSASGVEVCAVDSGLQVRVHSTCSDFATSGSSCSAPVARVIGMRGEVEDAQILIRKATDADDTVGGIANVTVDVHIDEDLIVPQVYRVGYVFAQHSPRYPGSGGGWRPDPLLPLRKGEAFSVPANVTQAIWVSLRLGREMRSGLYNGTVTITGNLSNGANFTQVVQLDIRALQTQLPPLAESNLGSAWSGNWKKSAYVPYYGKSYDWESHKSHWYDMMFDHRIPPDSIYSGTPRTVAEYSFMAERGAHDFALLDVTHLNMSEAHVCDAPMENVRITAMPM